MKNKKLCLTFILLLLVIRTNAQQINPELFQKAWRAYWISVPNESPYDFSVYQFRCEVEFKEKTAECVVHVSGDNRYKLFVKGQLASTGSAGDDINNWNSETVNIAPFFKEGKDADKELEDRFSNEKQVTKDTPPAFIVLAADDKVVTPANGINYFQALIKNNVYTTLHVYPTGNHGWDTVGVISLTNSG